LSPDSFLAVNSLKTPYREMASRHVLKMLNEGIVDGGAAKSADDRDGLRCNLLAHDDTKPGCEQRHQSDEHWRTFLENAAFGNETSSFANAFGQHGPGCEVTALRCIGRAGATTQGKDLDASEG
jgi:hypothetical protein